LPFIHLYEAAAEILQDRLKNFARPIAAPPAVEKPPKSAGAKMRSGAQTLRA